MWPTLDPSSLPGEWDSPLPLNVHSQALANSIFVKSGQGALVGFTIDSSRASPQFLQIFDMTSLPADGAIPDCVIRIPASTTLPFQWVPWRVFRVGCVICNSSTEATKTIGSADCYFDVQYI